MPILTSWPYVTRDKLAKMKKNYTILTHVEFGQLFIDMANMGIYQEHSVRFRLCHGRQLFAVSCVISIVWENN